MSQVSKTSSDVAPIEVHAGPVYLVKEYDKWVRCSIVANDNGNNPYRAKTYEDKFLTTLSEANMRDSSKVVYSPSAEDFNALVKEAESFADGTNPGYFAEGLAEENNEKVSTSMVLSGGSQRIEATLTRLKDVEGIIANKRAALDLVVQERLNKMAALKSHASTMLANIQKQVKQVMRIVTILELYLGIDEELVQIGEGERAADDEPITMRQLQLYMDEEYGDPADGGLDWTNLEDFDRWLVEKGGLDVVAPEKKCLVALRPRRYSKNYTDDAFANFIANIPNKKTYFLIRNGACVWRIFTENLGSLDTLFPKRAEMEELMKTLESNTWESDKEKADDVIYFYRKRAFFMQGLLDRTDCFNPIRGEKLNVMNLDGDERLRFIYDAEPSLSDGHLTWREFQKKNSETLRRGSRVVLAPGNIIRQHTDQSDERLFVYYASDFNKPPLPDGGLYELESKQHKRFISYHQSKRDGYEALFIKYNPGDTIYSRSWTYKPSYERKVRISWEINRSDAFVINYDAITLEDIDYYLASRIDRPEYLELIPTLRQIRKMKLQELESENHFKGMVRSSLVTSGCSQQGIDEDIDAAVRWWKMKTIFKRPIDKDDAKAFRMILKAVAGGKRPWLSNDEQT